MEDKKSAGNEEKKEGKETVIIRIDDHILEAERKQFRSGKTGFGAYGVIKVKGWPHRLSLNIIEM